MREDKRQERRQEALERTIAEWIAREGGIQSLITVTESIVSEDGNRALILISVIPEDKEETAIAFLKRRAPEIREYVSERVKMGAVPFLTFKINQGTKNIQLIEDISKNA